MSHAVQGHQDRQVIVNSSDKMWSIGERNSNLLKYSCLEISMDNIKRQKDMIPEGNPQNQKVSNVLLEKSREHLIIAPVRMKRMGQSRYNAQL